MAMNGKMLRDAFISAANNVSNNRKAIDALNVFPVPDGDTGTNMSMTIGAAKRELLLLPDNTGAGEVAQAAASALLRGARGNSGVILSLLFRGISKELRDKTVIAPKDMAAALEQGVDAAYKAVMKPTEGTILTVARVSAQKAKSALEKEPDMDMPQFWQILLDAAQESLASTPDLLPVLKKAGVVDAGGEGLVIIYKGMASVIQDGVMVEDGQHSGEPHVQIPDERNAAGEYEGEITFTYCTEFIVLKQPGGLDVLSLRAYLQSIGDSAVVVDDEEIIKCHVHTDNPGDAMQKALLAGPLTSIKIDNMREQHASQRRSAESVQTQHFAYVPVDPERDYGFVAVAAGDGIQKLFLELGVDNVVNGGQTMNPSTDDILEAVHATPAKNVIVLPNNKNIIMAAEQVVKLADRNVYVLPTKTIPQGYSAMLVFDPEESLAENQLQMVKATERVATGLITFAARDSVFGGHKIKKDEILALENGKLTFVEKELNKAVLRLCRNMVKKDSTFLTVIYGQDVTAQQAEELELLLRAKLPDTLELTLINGEQPVYYYILSVE